MTYPRAILRFALLTAVLGGATPALAAKRKAAKEATNTERKEATEPASAESKEAKEPVKEPASAEGKEAKEPVKEPASAEPKATDEAPGAESKDADEPAKPERREAKEPAREPTDDERKEAKEHAARGLYLFENGAHKGALAELERAYELVGSRLLLYRIASVYAAMGDPVEALENLDDLLADQGPLKPEYLERARALKEEQQQQVGQLDVKVNVPAAIEIDGARVGQAPLEKPIQVKAGQHMLAVVAEGHLPQRQGVSVAGSGTAEVTFELKPIEGKLAFVKVYSSVPAVEVLLDDISLGKTPIAEAVAVEPGKHVVELQRPGYMNQHRELTLAGGQHATVAFNGDVDRTAEEELGRLALASGVGEVRVTVDRRQRGVYRKPIALPHGPHVVKLEQDDFEPMELRVEVPRGGETELKVALRSKGVREAAVTAKAHTYRNWAIASLVSGAVLAGGGTAWALWQNSKLPAAKDNLAAVQRDADPAGSGSCSHPVSDIQTKTCRQRMSAAQSDVDGYKKWRLVGIGGAAVGAALVGVGVVLLATAPEAPATGEEETTLSSLVPVLSAGPGGASLLLSGRF